MKVERLSERVLMVDLEPAGTVGWSSVYVITGRRSLAIVDPGPRASLEGVRELLARVDLGRFSEVYVVLTHIHIDHAGVVGDLVDLVPRTKVFVHPRGVKHLVDPSRLWQSSLEVLKDIAKLLGEPRPVTQDAVVALEDGAELDLGDARLVALHTPGHAPHHISYILEPDRLLLAGDSIANHFNGRIYPVTVHPFDGEEYLDSLDAMLGLKPRVVAVTHYGPVWGDPEVFIQRARDKLMAWTHYVEEVMRSGSSSVDEVYRGLLSRDVELVYAKGLEDAMPAFRGSTYRVVFGLYNYLLSRSRRAS